jgi:hypothetical protein
MLARWDGAAKDGRRLYFALLVLPLCYNASAEGGAGYRCDPGT